MKTALTFKISVVSIFLTIWSPCLRAALILSESFDYGGTNGTLVGKGSAGSGWGGSWTTMGVTYTGSPTFTEAYQSTGLTFSTLDVSGGNAFLAASGDGFINAGRMHTAAVTGTLYGSFLFRTSGPTFTGLYSLFEGTSMGIASASAQFAIEPDAYASSNGGVITGGAYTYASGTPISAGETYLTLYKVTGLGGIAVSQTATMWVLRESQYATIATGGVTEAELNAATLGTGAGDILQRATRTITNSASFSSGGLMMIQSYFASSGGQFDEIRVSDTGFDELLTVPEPSRALLVGASLLALVLHRRRSS